MADNDYRVSLKKQYDEFVKLKLPIEFDTFVRNAVDGSIIKHAKGEAA